LFTIGEALASATFSFLGSCEGGGKRGKQAGTMRAVFDIKHTMPLTIFKN
jgi:hypothetical protein